MLQESILDKLLYKVKKLIPKKVFDFFQPYYHILLAYAGALIYGFPSKKMKVIGVTGTKGKSTVVYLISKLLADSGYSVGACGSLGFRIKDKEWPNTLKMTMPGRFRLQKLMRQAVNAGCEYFVLEVTSEGIKQKRHLGIQFDCAVFTNLHKEHLESHGSFENYYKAKQELFRVTRGVHVINAEDQYAELFGNFHSEHKIFYGLTKGDIVAKDLELSAEGSSFEVYGTVYNTHLAGRFNVMNFLAALAVGAMYRIDLPSAEPIIESVESVPGRMEFIQREPFNVVVDYAHTPESLEKVYQTLKSQIPSTKSQTNSNNQNPKLEEVNNLAPNILKPNKLICVLGAAGGGRDKWKRPEFGKIAAEYCDEIILTDEDPYDENPLNIIKDIESGFSSQAPNTKRQEPKYEIVINRKDAIKKALISAQKGDTVIITGKGSETSMALAGNKKIPWSDKEVVKSLLGELK